MKKKSIIAALLVVLLALPLFACAGELPKAKKMTATDYAIVDDAEVFTAYNPTSATEINLDGYSVNLSSTSMFFTPATKVVDGVVNYKLFNVKTETLSAETYYGIMNTGYVIIAKTTAPDVSPAKYKILSFLDGSTLIEEGDYTNLASPDFTSVMTAYKNGERIDVLRFKLQKTDQTDYTYVFFHLKGESMSEAQFVKVDAAELSLSSVPVGSTSHAETVYPIPAEEGSALDGYSYSSKNWATSAVDSLNTVLLYNTAFTLYKDGAIKETLNLESSQIIGYVDGKLIYSVWERLDAEAKNGYNVLIQPDGVSSSVKFDVNYFEYDILKGKTRKISDPSYLVMSSTGHFTSALKQNAKTKAYDAFAVRGVKFTDGVAILNDTTTKNDLLVNEDFKVIYDFTGKPFSATSEIYTITNQRFWTTSDGKTYILDENYDIVASIEGSSPDINHELGLIDIGDKTYDFDGALVYDDVYSNRHGYSCGAFLADAYIDPLTGEIKDYVIVDRNNLTGRKLKAVIGMSEDDTTATVTANYNGVIIKTTLNEDLTTYRIELFNFLGNKLTEVSNAASSYVTVSQSINKLFVSINVINDGTPAYKLFRLA